MSTDDREIELYRDPALEPGQRVISKKNAKNDGTMAGVEIGEVVVKKGEVGYVRDIGTFLQQFYIYAVDFTERGSIVGMRARELVSGETVERREDDPSVLQSHIATRDSHARKFKEPAE